MWPRHRRSSYLPDGTQRLLGLAPAETMTVEDLQAIVDRLAGEWGIDAPDITIDASVAGRIGRVTQLRGRTTMTFEPAVLALPATDAEMAVGHELGHLVHPAVPGSSLDGWRRAVLVLVAVVALSFPLTLVWPPLLAVSAATEVVTAAFVVQWAMFVGCPLIDRSTALAGAVGPTWRVVDARVAAAPDWLSKTVGPNDRTPGHPGEGSALCGAT